MLTELINQNEQNTETVAKGSPNAIFSTMCIFLFSNSNNVKYMLIGNKERKEGYTLCIGQIQILIWETNLKILGISDVTFDTP